ncbi:MAG TPA: protease pro-enzyme activation domain-containing protein [Terracidiphilus sp.]|nr:protease pro-enzyme activation domain-containing protein [Terracidiphilus sp.]
MANLRTFPFCALAGVLLCSAALTAQNATPAIRIVNPIDESQLVTLKGTVHPLANARNDRGAAPDSMQVGRVHLVLKRSDSQEAALKQLIGDMHNPTSPNYHKWLTPDQFGAQFGPSDQDIATVETWLTGHGFNVTKVNPGKQTIEITGNVAQLRTAFHTQIHKYDLNGETHFANASDPQIPAALSSVVSGFMSLNNFPLKSYAKALGKASYDPSTGKATPQWTIGGGTVATENFVLSPGDYAVQYDLNPLYTTGTNGAGQTIAIINESNINIDLVNQFRTLFGLPANPPQVIIEGDDPGVDGINNFDGPNYASVEAYLDVEWAGATAPGATVDLVIGADTALSSGLVLAAERAVYGNIAPIMSVSFGNCEKSLGSENPQLSKLWEQAAAQGITVVVSSGDAGSAGCDNDNAQYFATGGQAVNGFASTPYNIAVGGTDFYYSDYATGGASSANYWSTTASNTTPAVSINAAKAPIPEQPWNNSQFGLNIYSAYVSSGNQSTSIAGGGGGASNAAICSGNSYSTTGLCTTTVSGYPKPSWQSAATALGVPGDGVRDLPDVSLFAANGSNKSYYPICATDGDCQPVTSGIVQIFGVGGTSASTPAFAGIMALVNQKYGRQGQANTILYPMKAQFPTAFHDVTNGTNSVPCEFLPTLSPNCIAVTNPITVTDPNLGTVTEGQIGTGTTPEYKATAGYNLATGLGTVDANVMVTNWGNVHLATTSTTMTPSTTSFTHGAAVTINGTVTTGTGTPTGDVALMTDSTEQAQQGQKVFTLSSGSYSGSTSTLPGGTYNIWGRYGGDSTNGPSTSGKTQITVAPEASAIDFNIFSAGTHYTSSSGPGTSVDYGTQLMLSALVAPSSQASALQTCVISGTGCSSVNFTIPTGTVNFTDNGAALNTALINAEGDAEYNAPFTVGSHSVTATYAGDKSYNAAPATSPITFTVVKDSPVILYSYSTYNISQNPQNGTGQPTVLTFIVENNAQSSASTSTANYPVPVAAPSGTVTLSSSLSGLSGTATLGPSVDPSNSAVAGVATYTVPAGTVNGTYNITFSYSGDANYTAVTGVTGSITIQNVNSSGLKSSTTTATMTGSISPNSTVTISGQVTGSGTTAPTGGVYIYSSGNIPTSASFKSSSGNVSNFSVALSSQTLIQGANYITVQYSGDTVYNPSAVVLSTAISNPLSDFTLIPNTTIVPVTAGSNGTTTINLASVNGFSGTVNLTCAAATGITCTVPASATLTSGGSTTATFTVNAPSGATTGNYNVLVTGKDTTGLYIHTLGMTAAVTGTTSGTPGFTIANSGNITISAGATTGNTSTITVTPTNGFTGPVALSCAVTTAPAGATSPVTCSIPTPLTISGVSAGTANLTVNSTATTTGGTYVVTVTGTSGSITQTTPVTVAVSVPGFTLANSGSITMLQAATSGNTSTITATPTYGFTGAVTLSCTVTTIPTGATSPVTCNIPSSVTISSASAQTATLTANSTASTTAGAYAITVTGTSGTITQTTVVSVTVTSTSASYAIGNSGNITVTKGATTGNTSTISVTPSGGFTGTVNLTCAITPTAASDPATCALSSPSVTISGTTAVTSTLSVGTTAATAFNKPLKLFWPSTGGAVLALLFFFGVPRRRRNWLAMVGLLVLFVSGVAIGCGGGGGGGGNNSNPGTSSGTYTVTVTGTSGATTKTTAVTLTVQ